jgi:hypothetical protein
MRTRLRVLPRSVVLALLLGASLATDRVHAAISLPVFTSKCVGQPVSYPIPRHPIITFGDSITEGYGATNKCLPRELRAILPESAHRVYTGDTSYPGDLARLEHRMVLNYGVGGELTSDGLPRLLCRSDRPTLHTVSLDRRGLDDATCMLVKQ